MGGSANFNFRTKRLNFFIGGEYNRRRNKSMGFSERKTYLTPEKDSMFCLNNTNTGFFGRQNWNARTGLDIYITDNDILTFSGKVGGRNHFGDGVTEAETYYFNQIDSIIYNPNSLHNGSPYSYYTDEYSRNNTFYWSVDGNYQKKFAKPGHEIQIYFNYSSNQSKKDNEYTEAETFGLGQAIKDSTNISQYKTYETGSNNRYQAKIDYVLPFNEKSKLEIGYHFNYRDQSNDYNYFTYIGSDWVDDPSRHSPYDFNLNVQSGYIMYSNFWKNFGYQLGFRTEYTNRVFAVPDSSYVYKKFDFFPSVHLSYSFSEDLQIMASYSRRLERPHGYFLNPMSEVEDPNNIRRGNPALNPEYSNSYDLSLQKRFGEHFVSFELYARQTNDLIQGVTLVDPDNSNMYIKTFDNIGKDISLGSEIMGNFNPVKWYNLNASVNAFYYAITSEEYQSNRTFTWRLRVNNTFRIKKSGTNIQFGGFYNGPSITAQGRRAGVFAFNLGIKQEFFKKQLAVSLNFRDLFNTMRHNDITETDKLYYYVNRHHNWPNFNISITYRLNDFKKRKDKDSGDDSDDGGSEM
ncbi:MAG: TonB-dependent receptor, partial [Bacteroidales bacterium]|nr:TonB-dependent receptor [Bacteroidales bacterium]